MLMIGVLVFSNEGLSNGGNGSSERTLTLKDVLTPSTLDDPGVLHIALNAVAPTILHAALRRVASQAAYECPQLVRGAWCQAGRRAHNQHMQCNARDAH